MPRVMGNWVICRRAAGAGLDTAISGLIRAFSTKLGAHHA
jgi:hypothetical protein